MQRRNFSVCVTEEKARFAGKGQQGRGRERPCHFSRPSPGPVAQGLCGGLRLVRSAQLQLEGKKGWGWSMGQRGPTWPRGCCSQLGIVPGMSGPRTGRWQPQSWQEGWAPAAGEALCIPVGQGTAPRAEDSLHRGSGRFAEETCSSPKSHVAQILFVPLSARHNKAVCQGEYLFLHRCYHHLKHTQFGDTSLLQTYQKVIEKEKLSSSPTPLKAPGAPPHFVGGIISLLPLFFQFPPFAFRSLIKKYYFERSL